MLKISVFFLHSWELITHKNLNQEVLKEGKNTGGYKYEETCKVKTPSSVPTYTYMFKGYLNNATNMFDN